MNRSLVLGLGLVLTVTVPAAGQGNTGKTIPQSASVDFSGAMRDAQISAEVVATGADGDTPKFRLAKSVLLTDETGATDYHQTETLSDRVQVKKVFQLDSADLQF